MSSSPPRRRPWSLRRRLIAQLAGLLAIVCLVVGVVTEFALREFLIGQLDSRLSQATDRGRRPPPDLRPGWPGQKPSPPALRVFGQGVGTLAMQATPTGRCRPRCSPRPAPRRREADAAGPRGRGAETARGARGRTQAQRRPRLARRVPRGGEPDARRRRGAHRPADGGRVEHAAAARVDLRRGRARRPRRGRRGGRVHRAPHAAAAGPARRHRHARGGAAARPRRGGAAGSSVRCGHRPRYRGRQGRVRAEPHARPHRERAAREAGQ